MAFAGCRWRIGKQANLCLLVAPVAVMPILDITALGSTRSGTAGAVAAIVDLIAEKRIAYIKVGRHVRMSASVVDAFIAANMVTSAA